MKTSKKIISLLLSAAIIMSAMVITAVSAGGGGGGGAAPLQRVPHQPLSRCRRPLPRAERRRAVSGSCQCGERCAQGGKAVRGKELTTNANRFISVAPGAGT